MLTCPQCRNDLQESASQTCPSCGATLEWFGEADPAHEALAQLNEADQPPAAPAPQRHATIADIVAEYAQQHRAPRQVVEPVAPMIAPESEPNGPSVFAAPQTQPPANLADERPPADAAPPEPPAEPPRPAVGPRPKADDEPVDPRVYATVTPQEVSPEQLRTIQHNWGLNDWGRKDQGRKPEDDGPGKTAKRAADQTVEAPHLNIGVRDLREPDESGTTPADYELLEQIGVGAMGVVYEARQASIDRSVALKMLHQENAQVPSERSKFLSEAVVTGELDHPNIVPIYDLSSNSEGALFYSMKKVEGTPWNEAIRSNDLAENLSILLRVGDALAFAHARGVLHRDVKPENVMLGHFGEVLLMDWGIALVQASFRKPGAVAREMGLAGTPAYMSPEMVTGPLDAIDARSDVYLLGAVLFEVVAGAAPHPGTSVTVCLEHAASNTIRHTDKQGELLDIALKAMATDPADRYQTIGELQEAIRGHQSHLESIRLRDRAAEQLTEAEQTGDYDQYAQAIYGLREALNLWSSNHAAEQLLAEASEKYARRALGKGDFDLASSLLDPTSPAHQPLLDEIAAASAERDARQRRAAVFKRVAGGLAAAIVVVIVGALVVIDQKRVEADEARQDAQRQQSIAEQERTAAIALRDEQIQLRGAEAEARRQAEAEKARAESNQQQALAAEQRAVAAGREKEYESYLAQIGLADEKIAANAFTEARRILDNLAGSEHRGWEWARLRYLCQQATASYSLSAPVDAVAYSPDGGRLAIGTQEGEVRVYRSSGEANPLVLRHGKRVNAVAFSPDGELLLTGANDPVVRVWSVSTGEEVAQLEGHEEGVLSIRFSPDGSLLVTTSLDRTARLWTAEDWAAKQVLLGHNWWVWDAAFSPDGDQIVTAGQDGKAVLWQKQLGVDSQFIAVNEFRGHDGPVYAAAYAPSGDFVVTASGNPDRNLLTWNPATLEQIDIEALVEGEAVASQSSNPLAGHNGEVRALAFTPAGLLVSGGDDNTVRLWKPADGLLLNTMRGHGSWVRAVASSPAGGLVASGGHDNWARTWRPENYAEQRIIGAETLVGHSDAVLTIAFSPDGRRVITASRDNTAMVWPVDGDDPVLELREGHEFLATQAVALPDGRRVATAAADGTLRVWDIAVGAEDYVIRDVGGGSVVAVSPDGRWLATGSTDGALRVHNPDDGALQESLGHEGEGEVSVAAFSADGGQLFAGDSEGVGVLYRHTPAGWEQTHVLRGHNRRITSAVFTPDGSRLLTASGDKTVAQWDVGSGDELRGLVLRHPQWVNSIAITPDGKRLVTSCGWQERAETRVWDLERAEVVGTIGTDGDGVNWVDVSPAGDLALTVNSSSSRVRLWDMSTLREKAGPAEDGGFLDLGDGRSGLNLWAAAFLPDGQHVATVGADRAQVWAIESGERIVELGSHRVVSSAHIADDLRSAVTGGWDNAAKIWDLETSKVRTKLAGQHAAPINAALFFPQDAARVLTASDDGSACVWDAAAQSVLLTLKTPSRVLGADIHPDGSTIATAGADGVVRLWDAQSGEVLPHGVLQGHRGGVNAVAFCPEGRYLATASDDKSVIVWDAADGTQLYQLLGHGTPVTAVAFSQDESCNRIVTGSRRGLVKLWDWRRGKEMLSYEAHPGGVNSVGFSPDGKTLATAGQDGRGVLWPAAATGLGPNGVAGTPPRAAPGPQPAD